MIKGIITFPFRAGKKVYKVASAALLAVGVYKTVKGAFNEPPPPPPQTVKSKVVDKPAAKKNDPEEKKK